MFRYDARTLCPSLRRPHHQFFFLDQNCCLSRHTSNNDNLTNTQPHRALPQRSHNVHHSEQGGVRSP